MDDSYCAGLFDGEGTIQIGKIVSCPSRKRLTPTYNIKIVFFNTHEGALQEVQNHLSVGIIRKRDPRNLGRKPIFTLEINSRHAISTLSRLLPHLIIKKEQAELCIAFAKLNKRSAWGTAVPKEIAEKREAIYEKSKSLKH